jgi:hypothetical protein
LAGARINKKEVGLFRANPFDAYPPKQNGY